MLSTRSSPAIQPLGLEVETWRQVAHTYTDTSISHKADFRTSKTVRGKEGHCLMLRGSNVTPRNVYAPKTRASNAWGKTNKLKGEADTSATEALQAPPAVPARPSRRAVRVRDPHTPFNHQKRSSCHAHWNTDRDKKHSWPWKTSSQVQE